eukprot:754012-Hanusia_phi.AAC.1
MALCPVPPLLYPTPSSTCIPIPVRPPPLVSHVPVFFPLLCLSSPFRVLPPSLHRPPHPHLLLAHNLMQVHEEGSSSAVHAPWRIQRQGSGTVTSLALTHLPSKFVGTVSDYTMHVWFFNASKK